MKIGILSDLHLESSNIKLENLEYDVVVLAGDISQDFNLLGGFFECNFSKNTQIIYVPGNHEYEGKKVEKVIEQLKCLEKIFPNLHVLQNESINIGNVRFIGSTLWSNFEGMGILWKEEVKKWCKYNIIDFSYIFKKNKNKLNIHSPESIPWNTEDMEKEFYKAYDFITYELKKNETKNKKVVISHFAPSLKSLDKKYKVSLQNAYWVNNLPELIGFSDYWIHGHTHSSFDYIEEGTRVICNPRGYSKIYNLSENLNFNKNLFIEI